MGTGAAATLDQFDDAPAALIIPGMETKADSKAGILIDHADDSGVVEAFVSITGIVDEVDDVIIPGAYAKTLKARRPKGVFSHDWNRWVARTETIEEWLPGDPRITEALAKAGKPPLPKDAGVLYVKTRFNLKTDEGKNAYENVVFFSETGECEWSIGYQVPAGQSSKKDGIRYIKTVDLYEYSPVLFGAAPLSSTLSVKSRLAAIEHKGGGLSAADVIGEMHAAAEDEIDWHEVEHATLITPGAGFAEALLAAKTLLPEVDGKAAGGTDKNRGQAEQLRRWYIHNPEIAWGTDGDFMRCVKIAEQHMTPERAKGYCNLRHHDATGAAPGHAAGEGKGLLDAYDPSADLDDVVADLQAKHAAGTEEQTEEQTEGVEQAMESKDFPFLAGSYEERNSVLRRALSDALLGGPLPDPASDAARADMGMVPASGSERREWSYVEIVATFPDHVITRRSAWNGPNEGKEEAHEVGYVINDDLTVTLETPEPVRLVVAALGSDGADVGADEGANDTEPTNLAIPTSVYEGVDAVSAGVKTLLALSPETKAGRVLSGDNAVLLRAAVEHLITVLRAAGVVITLDDSTQPVIQPLPDALDTTASQDPSLAGIDMAGKALIDPALQAKSLLTWLDALDD